MQRVSFLLPLSFLALLVASGCSTGRPIQSGTLRNAEPGAQPESVEQRNVAGQVGAMDHAELKALNKKAGSPTFGLIMGFYQLPQAMPAGAVSVQQGVVFGQAYSNYKLENLGTKPYAVVPASAEQSEVLSSSMNHLLDAGVRFVEVSTADAAKVMQAEQQVIEGKAAVFPGRSVPSGVDLLVSIQKGQGASGPVYVGRVIRSGDGRLLALMTQPNAGPYSLSPLIQKMVSDSLKRLTND